MEGWLFKRGRGRSIAFVKPWANRYFVLDPIKRQLSYHAHANGQEKGSINVDGCIVVETTIEKSGKPFSFDVICGQNTDKEEVISLCAEEKTTQNAWMDALSLNGLNKVRRISQDDAISKSSIEESITDGIDEEKENSRELSTQKSQKLSGSIYKKHSIASQVSAGGAYVWVKRGYTLDMVALKMRLYNDKGNSSSEAEIIDLSGGKIEDSKEEYTGRPHSFILTCPGESIASTDVLVTFAAVDSNEKELLINALSSCMMCLVSPPSRSSCLQNVVPSYRALSNTETSKCQEYLPDTNINGPNINESNKKYQDSCRDNKSDGLSLENRAKEDRLVQLSIHTVLGKIRSRLNRGSCQTPGAKTKTGHKASERALAHENGALAKKFAHSELLHSHYTKVQSVQKSKNCFQLDENNSKHHTSKVVKGTTIDGDFKICVSKILSPGKTMRKYFYLLKLLESHSSKSMDRVRMKHSISEFESEYALKSEKSDRGCELNACCEECFPNAQHCSVSDLEKYIVHCNQHHREESSSDVFILIEVSIEALGYHRKYPCSLKNWSDVVLEKMLADPALGLFRLSDVRLKALLEQKMKDVLLQTIELQSRDQIAFEKCQILNFSPSRTTMIISQVLKNFEERAQKRASNDEACHESSKASSTPSTTAKRAPPPPPRPSMAIKTMKKKNFEFIPPPRTPSKKASYSTVSFVRPSSSTSLYSPRMTHTVITETQNFLAHEVSSNSCDGNLSGEPSGLNAEHTIENSEEVTSKHLYKSDVTPQCPCSREQAHDEENLEEFQLLLKSLRRDKWCKATFKRLVKTVKLKGILENGGDCIGFICRCCPSIYLNGSKSKKSITRIGMSALWLENIAMRLGTFWALPEREFLVEKMYESDPDGDNHVYWLSSLLLLHRDEGESDNGKSRKII